MQKSQDWCQFEGYELWINSGSRGKLSDKEMGRGGWKPLIFLSPRQCIFQSFKFMQKFQDWYQFEGNYLHITFHPRKKHLDNKWGRGGPKPSIFECRASAFFSLHAFKLMLKFQVWYQIEAKHQILWINFCLTGKHLYKKSEIVGGLGASILWFRAR